MTIPWHNYTFHRILEPDYNKFIGTLAFEIVESISRSYDFIVPSENADALNRVYNLGDDPVKSKVVDEEIILTAWEILNERR